MNIVEEYQPLHSTMFLLIRKRKVKVFPCATTFTFHYVSINTRPFFRSRYLIISLHSTMFLLILKTCLSFF